MDVSVIIDVVDPSMDEKQIIFTNLQLLGFSVPSAEAKYRIPFNKECWPIMDKKAEAQFRRVCNSWLTNIQKEESEAHLPRIVASIFLSPGGSKFYHLLFSFSTFVLHQTIKKECGVKAKDKLNYPHLERQNHNIGEVMGQAQLCGIVRCRKQYLSQISKSLLVNQEWQEYSGEQAKEQRRLIKSLRELEREARDESQKAAEKGMARGSPMPAKRKSHVFDVDLNSHAIKRAQRVQNVRSMWKQLADFSSVEAHERQVIESILDHTLQKYNIDAGEIDVKVPDLLLRECEKEIHRRHVDNTYQGGKLNLVSLVQLWNLSLHLYVERLHHVGVPNFESEVSQVSTQAHTHHAHLTNAKAFKEKISQEMLPELKSSIARLRQRLDTDVSRTSTPHGIHTRPLGFGLSAATPPVSFAPKEEATGETPKGPVLMFSPNQVETPEAACMIVDDVQKTSRKVSTKLFQGSPVYAPKISMQGHPAGANRIPSTKIPKSAKDPESEITFKSRARVKSAPSGGRRETSLSEKIILPDKPNLIMKEKVKAVNTGRNVQSAVVSEVMSALQSHQHPASPVPVDSKHATPVSDFSDKAYKAMNKPVLSLSRQQKEQNVPTSMVRKCMQQQQQGLRLTPAKTPQPKAHGILVDKIVSAMMDGNFNEEHEKLIISHSQQQPDLTASKEQSLHLNSSKNFEVKDVNLQNPTASLSQEAFVSRDRIPRSPLEPEIRRMWREAISDPSNKISKQTYYQEDNTSQGRLGETGSSPLPGVISPDFGSGEELTVAELTESAANVKKNETDIYQENEDESDEYLMPFQPKCVSQDLRQKPLNLNRQGTEVLSGEELGEVGSEHLKETNKMEECDDFIHEKEIEFESCLEDETEAVLLSQSSISLGSPDNQALQASIDSRALHEKHLDELFETKTPQIPRRGLSAFVSLGGSISDSIDQEVHGSRGEASPLRQPRFPEVEDEVGVTQVSFSPAQRHEENIGLTFTAGLTGFVPSQENGFDDLEEFLSSRKSAAQIANRNRNENALDISCLEPLETSVTEVTAHFNETTKPSLLLKRETKLSHTLKTSVTKGRESPTDDLIRVDDETSDILVSLDDSFVPLKDGFQLEGKSPGKPQNKNISPNISLTQNTEDTLEDDLLSRYRKLRKTASALLNLKTWDQYDEPLSHDDSAAQDGELHLSSSSSDDRLISALSKKYLHISDQTVPAQHGPDLVSRQSEKEDSWADLPKTDESLKFSWNADPNFDNDDILAEDDSILLPTSPVASTGEKNDDSIN